MFNDPEYILLYVVCWEQLHYYKQGKNEEFVRLLEASRTGKVWIRSRHLWISLCVCMCVCVCVCV